ncbi:hypothetical protein AK830_g9329 [Neonectria ditissima]|uniref:Protein CAP22 n=1 Tax=Neonectria ditissima TaxID=78410 RepID=A0A0P7AS38_9HYPO|nr:hypothetical protein AK830_g9329 [Neonectria ditissima]
MYAHNIVMAIAPLLLLASADLQLDNDDVPNACKDICQPIVTLTQRCEVDLRGDDNDRNENRLEAQCVCTNDSFDVASIAALCHDCIRQNIRSDNDNDDDDDDDDDDNDWDDSDLENVADILYTCGWSTTSYASSASTAADSITVSATAPTAVSQLTTTIVPGSTNTANANTGSGSNTASAGSSNTASADSSATTSDSDDSASTTSDSASQASETDNAAAALAPLGVAGLAVAGAFAMLL